MAYATILVGQCLGLRLLLAFRFVHMLVVTKVGTLHRSCLMLAIRRCTRPRKLERQQK